MIVLLSTSIGLRRSTAIPSASTTSSFRMLSSMDQPRTRRDQASMTAAQYTLPSTVGCSVMSVSHNRFGPSTVNRRLTRSLAGMACGSRIVVHDRRRRYRPWMPAWRISRATRFWFTCRSCPKTSSACTRGAPYVFMSSSAWISSISFNSSVFSCSRADAGRPRQS
ncbi:hypothetical protein MLP_30070 [Microlunatus phosphovorus NM-1]|uniref:Uncharacterized protein n=1 Tax=Microlunatus phosphovorus (strain ATCC 700054 / DSM 10555 / JCM 9379 / NBRC 101784 / NCIMB 13414 / VKM Ac-1990 / NM-1) TaxID=1032480 RepID=F5XKE9_MICPN|nr:hypothetical protein MLP_30070 [Microlunatus phosphovorus NM-1]